MKGPVSVRTGGAAAPDCPVLPPGCNDRGFAAAGAGSELRSKPSGFTHPVGVRAAAR